MAHVAMSTSNPLGRRPFSVMGELGDVWNLHEQDRSWIVRDTESAPIEHMRIPPELLRGMDAVPNASYLYRPGVAPEMLGADPILFHAADGVPASGARSSTVYLTLQPSSPAPPSDIFVAAPMPPARLPPMQQVVPPGATLIPVAWSSAPSTQTLVPVATAPPPAYSSVVAGGQPASAAQPLTGSWFTDPAQEVIAGVPNWGLLAAAAALALMMKGKR